MDLFKRLRLALALTLTVLVMGTVVYTVLEQVHPLDALYMTVITVSTVGFREVVELSWQGKLFTIGLIVLGVSTLGYAVGTLVEFMIEGHLAGIMEERRMTKQLSKLNDHFVVCGYGRVGQEVARGFAAAGVAFVVIDSDHDQIALCSESGVVCLEGDATDDEVLEAAGVGRARGLVAALDSDADNVFVTLTSRQMNRGLFVVARATREESEGKLRKAGADRVLSPAVIGGRRMASLALKPLVSEYLDIVTRAENLQLRLEEFEIGEASCMAGHSLKSARIREATGAFVLAVHKPDSGFNTNPPADMVLDAGDRLVVMGTEQQLGALERLDVECRLVPPGVTEA